MEKSREADDLMRNMTESNPQMNILLNEDYMVVDCNPAALHFMGFETKEDMLAVYTERANRLMPDFRPDAWGTTLLVERLIIAAKEGLVKFNIEMIVNGVMRNLDVEFKTIPYKGSTVTMGYIYDMTEMRARELELIRARTLNELQLAKLNLVVKATKIGLWDMEVVPYDPINPENPFNYSDEIRHMLGYVDETDFPNVVSSLIDLLHSEDKDAASRALTAHLKDKTGQTPYDIEYRLLSKNGDYIYFRASGETIRDSEGNAVRIAGALVDITETKNIILDSVRQRIEAEAASKAKSAFLSTMSHEIRTPMNAIIGMTTIGKKTHEIGKAHDAFNKIDGASKHLLGVINDILDMSKIEADKFDLSPVCFDFEKMLQKVTDVVSFRLDERRQRLYVNIDKEIPRLLIGDDQRLSQVITNLLSNAVKFTPEEGTIILDTVLITDYTKPCASSGSGDMIDAGALSVSGDIDEDNSLSGSGKIASAQDDGEICRLQISVEDTGIGITDEQKQRLFKKFEQAEAGTSRKYGGTGLGLAISKRIVELMDGEIWVDSESGKGSKFTFTISLKRGSDEKVFLLPDGVNWKNLRIFVVDDDPAVLEFFSALAEAWGVFCTVSASGEEAAKKLYNDNNYDIHFIDWNLPGINGGELIHLINENSADKPLVVIASSVDQYLVEDEAREVGVEKFLPKPLFPSMIVDMINECIGLDNAVIQDESADFIDDFSNNTILLAEDVEINRDIVMALLEPTGLTIDSAETGAHAVRMFEIAPDRYDLILMDVQMPEMDGHEATLAIRALQAPRAKSIPIIAMTANVFRDDIEKCLSVGMNDHIGKPVDFNDVLEKLRIYLPKNIKKMQVT